jgi:phage shock protein C
MNTTHKKLYLSNTDKKIAGVCGGMAEYFDLDPTLVRLAWIFFAAVTAIVPGVLAYIVAAIIIPHPPVYTSGPTRTANHTTKEGSDGI